ncbi:hypothetical protein B9Z65_5086 [Elsinoe australis]|uniref:deoxyribose-phosphate aldolase n=1 Tax=Elsinoe australis TaxID=40998 RepID=A0A2P7ZD46_9PEZI|nr:hypothetical protein B9Z65_5086 [Elsinoe australis]
MTTRYTDQEWSSIIAATEKVVHPAITQIPKAVPKVDSPQFAQTIDHTLLKLDATKAQIDDLCSEARVAGFASVCVRPNYTQQAVNNVKGTTVKVAVVIGFHTGENDLAQKMAETRHAVSHGALELDVVLNRTHLKAGEYGKVYNELAALRSVAPHPVLIKLILETSQLSDSEIIAAAVIARAVSFDFIKTSTGFLGHGATVEHVRLMSACCEVLGEAAVGGWAGHGLLAEYKNLVTAAGVAVEAPATPLEENAPPRTKTLVHKMQVKASGGVRTLEDAIKMLEAGATRLGTSAGVWIMKEAQEKAETGAVSSSNQNTSDYGPFRGTTSISPTHIITSISKSSQHGTKATFSSYSYAFWSPERTSPKATQIPPQQITINVHYHVHCILYVDEDSEEEDFTTTCIPRWREDRTRDSRRRFTWDVGR